MKYIGGNSWDFFTEAASFTQRQMEREDGTMKSNIKYQQKQAIDGSLAPFRTSLSAQRGPSAVWSAFQSAVSSGSTCCSSRPLWHAQQDSVCSWGHREIKDKLVTTSIIPDWHLLFSFYLGWQPSYSFLSPSPFSVWIQSKMSLSR